MASEVLNTQMDYIYFVYGLAFVLLAAICDTMPRDKGNRLPWTILGWFALIHGIHEWTEMLTVPLGDSAAFTAVRMALSMVSFLLLFEFGRRGWRQATGSGPGPWLYIPVLIGAGSGGWLGWDGLAATSRYSLGFPGAAWSALTLFREGWGKAPRAVGLILGAVALAGYAVASGIVVPAAAFFPADTLNAESFLSFAGFPIQVMRAVLAVLISASLWSYYRRQQRETLNADPGPGLSSHHGAQMATSLVVVLVIGWAVTREVGGHADNDMRENIRSYARVAAALIDPGLIKPLTGAASETELNACRRLNRQLSDMHKASPQFRWVHILTLDPATRAISVAASIPETSPSPSPSRRNAYRNPPPELSDAFDGHALLVGPYTDETGTYLSGFAPIRDTLTGRVVAVLALDLDAGQWRKDLAEFRLSSIAVTFLFALLLIGFFVVRSRASDSAERIAASESQLTEAQEVAHLGSWTYTPRTGRMTWSREMFRILDVDPLHTIASYDEHLKRMAPEDQARLDAAFRRALNDGSPYELELTLVRPHDEPRYVISRAWPKRDPNGTVIRLVGTMQDITARKHAEEAFQQERNLLRTLIDQLPDFIYVKDTQNRFVAANIAVARLMGASSPDELIGKTDADFYPPEQAGHYLDDEHSILVSGQPLINKDEPHVDPAGTYRAVLTTKIPMRGAHGEIVGLVGISRDITERKQAEEEIQRLNATLEDRVRQRTAELTAANTELETFTYSVSHDLRAPLRHMLGFLSLLQESLGSSIGPEAEGYIKDIGRASERMAALIDDLLDFSRIGRTEMHQERVELRKVLDEAIAELQPDTAGRTVKWTIGELPTVRCDAAMIRQVLVNLLDNALKFTRTCACAEIEIGSRSDASEHVLFVRDNGVGFDSAYAGKLFGVFQRLHSQAQFKGTGVGLANVRRIIQRHGGRTWAESEEGRGAAFYITIPVETPVRTTLP